MKVRIECTDCSQRKICKYADQAGSIANDLKQLANGYLLSNDICINISCISKEPRALRKWLQKIVKRIRLSDIDFADVINCLLVMLMLAFCIWGIGSVIGE